MINKLQNLSRGEKLVYYTGFTPTQEERPEVLATAYSLFLAGRVYLVQKLLSRSSDNPVNALGVFDYIAVGK